ncbi:MAG: bacterioferritin-associated ferredoxin [Phycisphaerae bacterium]
MEPDDKVCYCYHVSLRKLVNFARRERPARASGMSECLGAGTGCGWCIPVLKKIHRQALDEANGDGSVSGLPSTPEDYAKARGAYLTSDEKHAF